MNDPIYGIDLGTTNSCLAVMTPAGPKVLAIDGQPTVPSVVAIDSAKDEVIVGQRARNRLLLDPDATIRSVKRYMGQSDRLPLADRDLLPEEIAAEILRYLKRRGEEIEERPIERVVITVPAYFEDAQRRATLAAGELAGLEVVRLLNEPTAAVMLYGRLRRRGLNPTLEPSADDLRRSSPGGDETVLVYDLGGGTFDVSVVRVHGELSEVLASSGHHRLGGDDFDKQVIDFFLDHLGKHELSRDRRIMARLELAAEKAKIDLSHRPLVAVLEEALTVDSHLDLELARTTFEELIEPFLDTTLSEVGRAMSDADLDAQDIDRVILVGGSSLIPRVGQRLAERFACPVEHTFDPALCVALGAAVQGALLGGELCDQILVDVAAHSLGVKTLDSSVSLSPFELPRANHFSVLIRRNTQIPTSHAELYYTVVPQQERIEIEVLQGESEHCDENTLIGSFLFELLPAPSQSPILIEFRYDLDGIVHVIVEQKGTENRREVSVSTHRSQAPSSDSLDDDAHPGEARPERTANVGNYFTRKALKLSTEVEDEDLRQRLTETASAYTAAIALSDPDLRQVDRLEEQLLDLIEEAETPQVLVHGP